METKLVTWSEIKSLKGQEILRYEDINISGIEIYRIWLPLLEVNYCTEIFKGTINISSDITQEQNDANKTDFETNYKSKCNLNIPNYLSPFANKKLSDGSNLFRRVHGITAILESSGNKVVDFSIPYTKCKITDVEIINCPDGVTADFEVYYNTTKLNQFGFDVNIAKDYHKDSSPYDADLTSALIIKLTLKNSSILTNKVGINFILHEVV